MPRDSRGRSITEMFIYVNQAADAIKKSFDALAPGEPLVIVRYGRSDQPALSMAVKTADGETLTTRERDSVALIPVDRYAEDGHGPIAVIETPLRIDLYDMRVTSEGRPTEVLLGEKDIRDWVFGGCTAPYDQDAIDSRRHVIVRLIRLAAKIRYLFSPNVSPETVSIIGEVIQGPATRLAALMGLGRNTPETIAKARATRAELSDLGLFNDDGVVNYLLRLHEKEIREFLQTIASARR